MPMNKIIIDPLKIKESDLPLVVFSDHAWGFINWLIKWRTKGRYNHVMMMIEPGKLASQSNVFKSIPMKKYLRKGNRLKFWKFKRLTHHQKDYIKYAVRAELKKPWWGRRYDYLGILGQAVGISKINNPWLNYCSEIVRRFLCTILMGLPYHPSPKELNEVFKHDRYKEDIEVLGYWFDD